MLSGFKSFNRRQFLKLLAYLACILGIEQDGLDRLSRIFARVADKPRLIWLTGTGCGGCSLSLIGSQRADIVELLGRAVSLTWHPFLSQEANEERALKTVFEEATDFYLIVEGAVSKEDRKFSSQLSQLASRAQAVIAAGACASSGGILSAGNDSFAGISQSGIRSEPIRLSTCPLHPEHLLAVLSYLLYYGRFPELDNFGRPVFLFGSSVHESCPRRGSYEEGKFLKDYNSNEEAGYCLLLKGCRGFEARSDCAVRQWNDGLNWCIASNGGCQACSEANFLQRFEPFKREGSTQIRVSGKAAAAAAGAVAGATAALGAKRILKKHECSIERRS